MVDSPWRRCIRDGAVVLSVATNAAYVEHVQQLASTAEVPCVIVACSSLVVPSLGSSNVQLMQLPYSSTWRPPPRWCQQRKAGWRHAAILKLEALLHLLVTGVDVLVLDADWRVRVGQNPVHAARSTGRDVVGLRDVTRHQLNIGAVYVRSTAGTVHAVRRAFNRTHVAWLALALANPSPSPSPSPNPYPYPNPSPNPNQGPARAHGGVWRGRGRGVLLDGRLAWSHRATTRAHGVARPEGVHAATGQPLPPCRQRPARPGAAELAPIRHAQLLARALVARSLQ